MIGVRIPDNLAKRLDKWCEYRTQGNRSVAIEMAICRLLDIKFEGRWQKEYPELYRMSPKEKAKGGNFEDMQQV